MTLIKNSLKAVISKRIIPAIIAAFIMAAALIWMLPSFAFADIAPSLLSMDASYDFDNFAKGGRYLPLHININNNTGVDYEGELCIFTKAADQEIYEYSESTTVYAGSDNEKLYYIPIAVNATSIHIVVKDENGIKQEIYNRVKPYVLSGISKRR